MNVIGSRPTGWWRDRPAAAARFAERLRRFAAGLDEEVILVLDGRPSPQLPAATVDGVRVVYARRGGPDAADDRIVELVAAAAKPEEITVFSSDRRLVERVRELGASARGAGELLRWLDRSEEDEQ